ncbi:DUF2484 family protein [Pseudorhodobacter wandonensis]|jgi:uncharacterized membrane protein|uniref:DUF2484 family protein n=1 Tax=Pseudorhodobacter wandonensis TaxID=1120568 RepID=UPI00067A7516|nr:DUF2484 family protein [Pseudorhodobacter wandonensis]
MTAALTAALIWLVAANVTGFIPSRDYHWRAAYALIAVGIPILGWVTWVNGPIVGLIIFAMGASVLRWPLVYFWRWMKAKVANPAE